MHPFSLSAVCLNPCCFGEDGRKSLKKLVAENKSLKIVADETYAPSDVDMSAQLTKIRQQKPDAIINWSIVPAQSILPKNMKQLKITTPFYQSHGYANLKYVKASGNAATGIRLPAGRLLVAEALPETHPQKKLLVAFKKDYESFFKEEVSTFGGHAYDALNLFVKAITSLESETEVSRALIRDALEEMFFLGTAGAFQFSKTDHSGLDKNAFEMLVIQNGRFEIQR